MINKIQIDGIKAACKIAKETLDFIEYHVKPGVTTKYLNDLCATFFESKQAESACLHKNFPDKTCISVNEVVCHGVPNDRIITNYDLVNIDIAVYYKGYYGDTARTFCMPDCSEIHKNLCEITRNARDAGISKIRHGAFVGDIGHAILSYVKKNSNFTIISNFCGHGIVKELHEYPQIPNTGFINTGPRLLNGMTITVEPVLSVGKPDNYTLNDNWTVVTSDNSYTAQWEHTILVTTSGYEILT